MHGPSVFLPEPSWDSAKKQPRLVESLTLSILDAATEKKKQVQLSMDRPLRRIRLVGVRFEDHYHRAAHRAVTKGKAG